MKNKNNEFRVAISYPPLNNKRGVPHLSQNRQFFWSLIPCYIYPMVPAYAATLLKKGGCSVLWDDGIAQRLTFNQWFNRLKKFNPHLVVIESKTPVIKRHWQIIDEIKKKLPKTKVVLVGDHVTALPKESLTNSKVDFVATGGDYDFLILNIANFLNLNQPLEPGIFYRKNKFIKNTGHFILNHDLDQLPLIDRGLTQWKLYAFKNGNYKNTPGTYIISGRDCWWGRCRFCSWTTLYPGGSFRRHSVKRILDEIGFLIEKYQVREIMDDSGTFPVGPWLKKFCYGMIERGYNKKIRLNCNMRLNALNKDDYRLMAKAGFRMILFGLESANQKTLDLINKNLKVAQIEKTLSSAKKAGLEPHLTTMVGYPWETKSDVKNTINLVRKLTGGGLIDSLQATILIPYPGTPLFSECQRKKLLLTQDWDKYDQSRTVIKSRLIDNDIKKSISELYQSFLAPKFMIRKVVAIRSWDDVWFLIQAGWKMFGHLMDFTKN